MRPLTRGFTLLGLIVAGIALVNVVEKTPVHQRDISTAELASQLNDTAPPPKPLTPAEQKKIDAEFEASKEPARVAYAKFTEDNLLAAGYNVDVVAYGPKHKYLKLKWILVSKVTAYQFSHDNSGMWQTMREAGFTKFAITDGYDETWTWDLTK